MITVKIRKSPCTLPSNSQAHSDFAGKPNNVFIPKKWHSRVTLEFSYHVSLTFFTLRELLSLSLTCMTLIPVRMTVQLFCRIPSIWLCLMPPPHQTQVMHLARLLPRWGCCFLVASTRWHVISMCPISAFGPLVPWLRRFCQASPMYSYSFSVYN